MYSLHLQTRLLLRYPDHLRCSWYFQNCFQFFFIGFFFPKIPNTFTFLFQSFHRFSDHHVSTLMSNFGKSCSWRPQTCHNYYFVLVQTLPSVLYMVLIFSSTPGNQRSSHQKCSARKGVLRNFTKFTEKRLCQSLFFDKVAGLSPVTLLKKKLWHGCFPVSFMKFLRTSFYLEHLWWLLLNHTIHLRNRKFQR